MLLVLDNIIKMSIIYNIYTQYFAKALQEFVPKLPMKAFLPPNSFPLNRM